MIKLSRVYYLMMLMILVQQRNLTSRKKEATDMYVRGNTDKYTHENGKEYLKIVLVK